MVNKSHEPTRETRELVQLHATVGTPQKVIADILDIDAKTLRKHYRAELDQSTAKANAKIGGLLYRKATEGDTTAMIFWMKTRAKWSERHEIGGFDGEPIKTEATLNVSGLSDAALAELMAARKG